MRVPSFSLQDQNGVTHTPEEWMGQWLLIYVYPKDNTPGCTKEACAIRDDFETFRTLGIAVAGMSGDSVQSHKKFADAYQLPFPLLSDPTKETMKVLGAIGEKKFMGRTFVGIQRKSFLVNPEGEIVKTYEKVTPAEHAQEVLADVRALLDK